MQEDSSFAVAYNTPHFNKLQRHSIREHATIDPDGADGARQVYSLCFDERKLLFAATNSLALIKANDSKLTLGI